MKKLFLLFAAVTLFVSLQAVQSNGKKPKLPKPKSEYFLRESFDTVKVIRSSWDIYHVVNGDTILINKGVKTPAPCVGC